MKLDRHSRERVISFRPDGEYYYQKGMAAYQKGDLYRAKKFVERAVDFNPDEPEYLCQLAAILAELEQYEASNQLLQKVVSELDESLTECYFFMANNYAYLGRYEDALREIKTYLALEPRGGFSEEAHELYRILLLEAPGAVREEGGYIADHEKGRKALEQGQYQKAIYYFQKVIEDRPEFWAAYNNLAIAHFSIGEADKSFRILDKVLEQDPGNVHALCNLATFYFHLGDFRNLEKQMAILDKLYPFFPEHQSKLGATYFFVEEYEKAFRWLKLADRFGGFWDQIFYFWLALSAYRIGKTEEALKAWARVDFFSETPFHPFEYGKVQEMLWAKDAKANPLARSLLRHVALGGQLDAKIAALFALRAFGDADVRTLFADIATNRREKRTVRQIARQLAAALENRDAEAVGDRRLEIMLVLEEKIGGGRPLIDQFHLYGWWRFLFERLEADIDPSDVRAWAASLDYLRRKEQHQPVLQEEIAGQYETSADRLRYCLNCWERWMENRITARLSDHRKDGP